MTNEKITAWVTKYALTDGVLKVQGEVSRSASTMFIYGEYWQTAHCEEWHRTEQAALDRAEFMRTKKIASLEKQLAKMRALKIQVVDQTGDAK